MLPIKFQANWLLCLGEEAKKKIFKMATMAAILDFRSVWFSYFYFTSPPDASYQVWSQLAFRLRRISEK